MNLFSSVDRSLNELKPSTGAGFRSVLSSAPQFQIGVTDQHEILNGGNGLASLYVSN
jgi:hypothetical protein